MLGPDAALPLSGVLLSFLIFAVAFVVAPWIGAKNATGCWIVGGLWVFLTVAFELLFGRYVVGRPWQEVLAVFNVLEGNLMSLALVTAGVAPCLAARIRGLI
jgi:hypothetical protein